MTREKAGAAPLHGSIQETLTSAPKWIPSATELERAGVKFEKNNAAVSFLSITFEQRKMKIITSLLCLSNLCLKIRSGSMKIP